MPMPAQNTTNAVMPAVYRKMGRKSGKEPLQPIEGGGRYSCRLRAASPNGLCSDDSSATDESDQGCGMRIGDEYQAVVPDMLPTDACQDFGPERALLVWSPCGDITDTKLDEYIILAKEKYGYNAEQALGMLFWHKYDLAKALADLPNFTPFPDEWSVEDKVLFEQAFQFHGKSFQKIRQMLPDKSISSLVKYYYSWKKTRSRTSLMDRQARKLANQREDGSDIGSEAASENESDIDSENKECKDDSGNKTACSNCNVSSAQLWGTPKGSLCSSCYQYWRRTGLMRNSGGPIRKHESTSARHNPMKSKRKPPRGMYLHYDDLLAIATGAPGQGDAILKAMDSEVVSLKRQVQNNKQIISQLKHKLSGGIEKFRPTESNVRTNARWTHEELLLAVQGIRKYGRDFKAIAEVIGNKSEVHVRSFYINYGRRFKLEALLHEHEAEVDEGKEEEVKDEKSDNDSNASGGNKNGTGNGHPESPAVSSAPPPPPLLRPALGAGSTTPVNNQRPHPPPLQQAPIRSSGPRMMLQHPPPLICPSSMGGNSSVTNKVSITTGQV